MPRRSHAEFPRCIHDAHTAAANSDLFASNGFKRSSAQSAAERNFLPSSQSTETKCVGGWVYQKPDDKIRCPNPLAYGRKTLMSVHALPAASALANFPPFRTIGGGQALHDLKPSAQIGESRREVTLSYFNISHSPKGDVNVALPLRIAAIRGGQALGGGEAVAVGPQRLLELALRYQHVADNPARQSGLCRSHARASVASALSTAHRSRPTLL